MFCPKCNKDYSNEVTRCGECGARLVARHNTQNDSLAVLAWHGSDPVAFSAVLAALQGSHIRTHEISVHYHLSRQPGDGSGYGIYVNSVDCAAATGVIAEVLGGSPQG